MTIAESNESKGFDLEHILWHIFNANSTVPSMFERMRVCMYVCAIYCKSVILYPCSAYFLYMLEIARYLFSA